VLWIDFYVNFDQIDGLLEMEQISLGRFIFSSISKFKPYNIISSMLERPFRQQ